MDVDYIQDPHTGRFQGSRPHGGIVKPDKKPDKQPAKTPSPEKPSETENPFIAAFEDEKHPTVSMYSYFGDTSTYKKPFMAKGKIEDLQRMAAEAVLRLGGNDIEHAVLINKSGPYFNSPDGTRVAVHKGDNHHVVFPPALFEEMAGIGHMGQGATFEIHHNHPQPYTLSLGDITALIKFQPLESISAYDMDGGSSTARLALPWFKRYKLPSGLPTKLIDASRSMHGLISDEEYRSKSDREKFMMQHAFDIAMNDTGIIKYEYKLSPKQQQWIDEGGDRLAMLVAKGVDAIKSHIIAPMTPMGKDVPDRLKSK